MKNLLFISGHLRWLFAWRNRWNQQEPSPKLHGRWQEWVNCPEKVKIIFKQFNNFQTLQSANSRIVSSVSWSAMTSTSSWSTRTTLSSFVTLLTRTLPQFRLFSRSHQKIIHTTHPRIQFCDAQRECSLQMTWLSTAVKAVACFSFVVKFMANSS